MAHHELHSVQCRSVNVSAVYNPREDPPATWIEESPLVSVQEAAVELEHLLEKPSLTAGELKGLVHLFSRLLGHPLTGSADNDPRKRFLSFYWEG